MPQNKPTIEEALDALKVLITWVGDDPKRKGLQKTPERILRSWTELFSGYGVDPASLIGDTFHKEIDGYHGMVALRDINFLSHCEHHWAPFCGKAHIAYSPGECVVGISKIPRVVEAYAKRFQIQEKMTAQIATTLESCLKPLGVVVLVDAKHHCLCHRGIKSIDSMLSTIHTTGIFQKDSTMLQQAISMLRK